MLRSALKSKYIFLKFSDGVAKNLMLNFLKINEADILAKNRLFCTFHEKNFTLKLADFHKGRLFEGSNDGSRCTELDIFI